MNWLTFVELCYQNIWLVALLPLLAFVIITFDSLSRRLFFIELLKDNKWSALTVIGATGIGLVQSLIVFIFSLHTPINYATNYEWLSAGKISISLGYLVDNLSIMMLVVVTSISLLIQIYTHGYMKKDDGYRRFYSFLALFNFSMLGLVLSSNLIQLYIFWELVGLCSYFLIGFWFDRPSASKAAMKAFVMNRIGDCLFLIGILALLGASFSFWTSNNIALLDFQQLQVSVNYIIKASTLSPMLFSVVAICLFFGAITKSAQFPLHTWLPDAMEGPTPISALIHAATMVAAGVFLVARIYPVLAASEIALTFIAIIGAITLFMAATIAMTQTDIKRVLAYSTCSQLGYMIFAMGIGAYSAALFHLCTHAYFKAMLFLCSGSVIHGVSGQQDMKYMGGLRKYMPTTAITYLVGAISISGILFSGFWSKDLILGKAFETIFTSTGDVEVLNLFMFLLAFLTAGLTAFYMFRSYFMTFEGEYRGLAKPHESPKVMTVPLVILAVPSVLLGFILSGTFGLPDFSAYIHFGAYHLHHPDYFVMLLSLLVALIGIFFAAMLYWKRFQLLSPEKIQAKIHPLYTFSKNKWYIDELYSWGIQSIFIPVCSLMSAFDKFVVDLLVNMSAISVKLSAEILKWTQSAKVQWNVLATFTGIVLIALLLIVYIHI